MKNFHRPINKDRPAPPEMPKPPRTRYISDHGRKRQSPAQRRASAIRRNRRRDMLCWLCADPLTVALFVVALVVFIAGFVL